MGRVVPWNEAREKAAGLTEDQNRLEYKKKGEGASKITRIRRCDKLQARTKKIKRCRRRGKRFGMEEGR